MNKNGQKNQQQHYVPRVVLSHFSGAANKRGLFVFDKHSGTSLPGVMSVDKICKEGGYYVAKHATGSLSIEDMFHPLENEFREIVTKITATKSISCLSEKELYTLVIFVCAQYVRVPRIRTAIKEVASDLVHRSRNIAPNAPNIADIEKAIEDDQVRLHHFGAISNGIVSGARLLSDYHWFVMESQGVDQFWLSDCPVVLQNDEDYGPYGGLGLAAPGVQIYFPVTPSLIVAGWHPILLGKFMDAEQKLKQTLGQLSLQYSCGIAPNKSALREMMQKLKLKLQPVSSTVAAIKTGGLARASSENVLFYNWLQFKWSHRFILCASGNFSMADKMLKEHPTLRTGVAMSTSQL